MRLTERFLQYAAAFEECVADDDWSRLEAYFTEDAVYETKADPPYDFVHEGRAAVCAGLKASLDNFDRRFADRRLELLEGPTETDDTVWLRWRATYTVEGAPDLSIEGEERARFVGDRIARLEDTIPSDAASRVTAYFGQYGDRLLAP